jgi:NhaP-type Na+/H+ or K+/H+ antiporter
MLGLGLLGLHELGAGGGWRWLAVDVLWRIAGGLGIGFAAGTIVARIVLFLRRRKEEAIGLDDFLSLGLLALSYGLALAAHTYGFLAVFAAGAALRRIEVVETGGGATVPDIDAEATSPEELARHPDKASAYMAHAVLGFNQQLERICEVALVLLVGGLLSRAAFTADAAWFIPLLLLVIRPVSVLLGLAGTSLSTTQRALISWFGIRGIGSVYYLTYAITHGLDRDAAQRLSNLALTTIAVSITVHGVSVTPLMDLYRRRRKKEKAHQVV